MAVAWCCALGAEGIDEGRGVRFSWHVPIRRIYGLGIVWAGHSHTGGQRRVGFELALGQRVVSLLWSSYGQGICLVCSGAGA